MSSRPVVQRTANLLINGGRWGPQYIGHQYRVAHRAGRGRGPPHAPINSERSPCAGENGAGPPVHSPCSGDPTCERGFAPSAAICAYVYVDLARGPISRGLGQTRPPRPRERIESGALEVHPSEASNGRDNTNFCRVSAGSTGSFRRWPSRCSASCFSSFAPRRVAHRAHVRALRDRRACGRFSSWAIRVGAVWVGCSRWWGWPCRRAWSCGLHRRG